MKQRFESRKEGIALVVVLGFLTIMTIISIGLAVAMRTERLASANYINMSKARILCNAALSDSMLWLEEAMADGEERWGKFVVAPCFRMAWQEGLTRYMWMLPSRDPVPRAPDGYDTFQYSLVDGLATNFHPYIPTRYSRELPADPQELAEFGAQWIHVTDPETDKIVARFMYVIFEASAYVDMNYIGREIVPGFRTGHDIELFYGSDANRDSFYSMRPEFVRTETAGDLLNTLEYGTLRYQPLGEIDREADWFLFSYAPPMRRIQVVRCDETDRNAVRYINDMSNYGDGSEPILIGRDQVDFSQDRNAILEAFGIIRNESAWREVDGATTADELFLSLQDFADSGFTPVDGNHNRPTVKPVPMINEVHLAEDRVEVEVWKPFVGPTTYTGRFRVDVELEGEVIVDGELETITYSLSNDDDNSIGQDQYEPIVVLLPMADEGELSGQFDVTVRVVGTAGETLDEVDGILRLGVGEYAQVNDPRFNHMQSQWDIDEDGSLWEINSNADFIDRNSGATDGDYLMYTARGPLITPGDLGYLPVAPWRTIKLYEDHRRPTGTVQGYDHDRPDMDRVLDYFTMQDGVSYGLMSVNSGSHNARSIGSIFDTRNQVGGGYLSMYIGEPQDDSTFLHSRLIASGHGFSRQIRDLYRGQGQPSVNIADFGERIFRTQAGGRRLEDFKDESIGDPRFSELRISHLMRRVSALGTVRQNMFVVCIWTQVLGDGDGDNWESYPVLSEAQAVAHIWRDPYPFSDDDQYHPKFIRYMRWM